VAEPAALYLDLLKRSLTRAVFDEVLVPIRLEEPTAKKRLFRPVERLLSRRQIVVTRSISMDGAFDKSPPRQIRTAETLIGPAGLDNLQFLIEDVLSSNTPGDLIETGVWRGGASIFMRGVLAAYDDPMRIVWVADSFAGLPRRGTTQWGEDEADLDWAELTWLAVPLEEVKAAFERYGLLDDQVRFLAGWFHETLPAAPIDCLALMRLDGDMYGSTMDALETLYPKLSVGGYVVIDDYQLAGCRSAVDHFRGVNEIEDELVQVDRAIVYWQRSARTP
jgi:O-methyltransferase